ncbi:hypothetical protein HZH68_016453 [Vespula germanica]|uniref:Uncharacterized protein n=1 Tax=Vespula germanica TaxID=30212 RepID=A0A834J2G5_VESGE|nr:hypothetical protein HZH68_016453 [Vespula germanica]
MRAKGYPGLGRGILYNGEGVLGGCRGGIDGVVVGCGVSGGVGDLKEEDDEVEEEEKEEEEEEEEGSVRRHFIRKASRKCSFALKQDFPSPWFKRMLEVTNDV